MSLPELFRFQDTFIGCLTVRRFMAAYGAVESETVRLRDGLMFRWPAANHGVTHIAILAQGYDYDGLACPALDERGSCTLHARGKPAMCDAVPLDPLLPDGQQSAVLGQRRQDAAYMAADCIVAGNPTSHAIMLRGSSVEDTQFSAALKRHREALAADRHAWGDSVFDMLRQDTSTLNAVPQTGYMALPAIPALLALAAASDDARTRCRSYAEAQIRLIGESVAGALARRRPADRPMTLRLRAWRTMYVALCEQLATPPRTVRNDDNETLPGRTPEAA